MKLGIVGLPNVGKSTLFNAITSTKNAEAANYPFCTIEPNSGIVAVPDKRLDNRVPASATSSSATSASATPSSMSCAASTTTTSSMSWRT